MNSEMFIKCGRVVGFLQQSHCISLSKLLSQPCCKNFVTNLYLTSFDLFQSRFSAFKTKWEKVYKLFDNTKPIITKSKHPYPQLNIYQNLKEKIFIHYILFTVHSQRAYSLEKVPHASTCTHKQSSCSKQVL